MSRTPRTPRSRTPSRVGTPIPGVPSRLVPPQLRSAPSVSSLRVFSHGTPSAMQTPLSGSPPNPDRLPEGEGLPSPAMNPESTDGILIQEPDVEVETIDGERGTVSGHMESNASDEEAKRNLREHLRRTLTDQEGSGGECCVESPMHLRCVFMLTLESIPRRTPRRGRSVEMDELSLSCEAFI